LNWAVATTQPSHEGVASCGLDRLGLTSYTPRYRDGLNRAGGPLIKPLFPGYLFIHDQPTWRPVLSTRGITGVLGLGNGRAMQVGDDVVSEIRDREAADGIIDLPPELDPIHPGVRVRCRYGALFGAEGICCGMRGRERVDVLLSYLGRMVKTNMKKADLVPA
jgi:transcription antitermination factor NusG